MTTAHWIVRTGAAADTDIKNIVRWTAAQFGPSQARTYSKIIEAALQDLRAGPSIVGSQLRTDLGPNLHTLHVGRMGRKGRHFLMFRVRHFDGKNVIEVIRILHDSMDLQRHLPAH